jgi:hypothetical protein
MDNQMGTAQQLWVRTMTSEEQRAFSMAIRRSHLGFPTSSTKRVLVRRPSADTRQTKETYTGRVLANP